MTTATPATTGTANPPDRANPAHGSGAVQLRLLPGGTARPDWVLDERTRKLGRQGVAQAREILRRTPPPEPEGRRKAS